MQQAGVNAADLARESGVSMASLSRILSGETENPSFSSITALAQALGVSLNELAQAQLPVQQNPADVQATYVLENTDQSPKEAAQLLQSAAAGTWVSTWTEDFVDPAQPRPYALHARKVGTKRIEVDLVFPHSIFETGSLVGLMSVLAAGITSTNARLLDVQIPASLGRSLHGPAFGVRGLRDLTGKYGRPLLSCTLRPMLGIPPKMYGRAIFEALQGGCDLTCDPTLLHSIPGLTWRERFRYAAEAVHAAGAECNEYKAHAANVTAATTEDMLQRASYAKDLELGMLMVDSAGVGWSALQSLSHWCRDNDMILCAMGGRALQGGVMSEALEAKLLRLAGCDVTSIGSPLRGSVAQRRYSIGTVKTMRAPSLPRTAEEGILHQQDFYGMEGSLPAVGGGHNPWHFPRLLDALGDDLMIQCGGSVMAHPWGSAAGATANRVAIEALVQARGEGYSLNVDGRIILNRAQKYSPELKEALAIYKEGAFLFGVVSGDGGEALSGKVERPDTNKSSVLRAISTQQNEGTIEDE